MATSHGEPAGEIHIVVEGHYQEIVAVFGDKGTADQAARRMNEVSGRNEASVRTMPVRTDIDGIVSTGVRMLRDGTIQSTWMTTYVDDCPVSRLLRYAHETVLLMKVATDDKELAAGMVDDERQRLIESGEWGPR